MDNAILVPSIVIGLALIVLYLFRCYKQGKEANPGIVINAVLYASGIVCGGALMLSAVFPPLEEIVGGTEIYIFIGGLAVLFVSSQGVHRDIIKATRGRSSESAESDANRSLSREQG